LRFQVNNPLATFHVEQPVTTGMEINASDGAPVEISGIPVSGEGGTHYCCLVKQGQYFFASLRSN
jgi:hypothetical protein